MAPRLALAASLVGACDDTAIAPRPTLSVAPLVIDFGRVPTGETRRAEIRLENTSATARLLLERAALAEGTSAAFVLEGALEGAPLELGPGQEFTLRVRYTAGDAEPDAGHVEIDSNALDGARLRIPISSARTFPRIVIEPADLELGSVATGDSVERALGITSAGDAPLVLARVALRTEGFAGEPCVQGSDCREGRCTSSRTGSICALACEDGGAPCPSGYECSAGTDGFRACREGAATSPPLSARGFTIRGEELSTPAPLLPGRELPLTVAYAPVATDRGSAQLVVESNDPERPVLVVPLRGRPDDLPPVAVAELEGAPAEVVEPGTRLLVTGRASRDPEGSALGFAWRFVVRPEGSRARFEDARAEGTAFTVDLPGRYVAFLEVRDSAGLTSTNEARIEVVATAGRRVRVTLAWDRAESDLDLHLASPGAPIGSLGDCFFDNPRPDFPPLGPPGDPVLTATAAAEVIALEDPGSGVYTIAVRAVAASPRGATQATISIFLGEVEAATFAAALLPEHEQWDVATLTWPEGRLTALGTVR